jgi:YHS domain-containing protein
MWNPMYRILLIAGLLILFYYLIRRATREIREGNLANKQGCSINRNQMVQDPVCRVFVPREGAVREEIGGQMYFFCSRNCANVFQKQLSN